MAPLEREHQTLRWRFRRIRRMPARQRWAKYGEVLLRLLRSGAIWPERDFDYENAAEIACRYLLPGHDVPMHLFVSEGTAVDADADQLGWDEYHKGRLTAHQIGHNHVSILELPEVGRLSQMMLESLREAKTSTR
jgi:hypothetical protein